MIAVFSLLSEIEGVFAAGELVCGGTGANFFLGVVFFRALVSGKIILLCLTAGGLGFSIAKSISGIIFFLLETSSAGVSSSSLTSKGFEGTSFCLVGATLTVSLL